MADQFPTTQDFYDAEKDLRTMDAVSNSRDPDTGAEIDTWLTRRGGQTDTVAGRLKALGIERIGDFTAGCTVTKRNQGVLEVGGSVYVWLGVIPGGGKIVPPGSTPASTGGIGPTGWLDVGDASLRSDLIAPDGVGLVGGAAKESDVDALTSRVSVLEQTQDDEAITAANIAKQLADGQSPQISAFGDSVMNGLQPPALTTQSPSNPPAELALALNKLYGGTYTVNNRGIGGTTLRQMLAGTDGSGSTFESKISAGGSDQNSAVIYCNHGINDSAQNLPIGQYRSDLITFVRLCRDKGKVPILVTPNPNPPFGQISETKSKRLRDYVSVMRDVAKKLGCDLVDNFMYFEACSPVFRIEEIVTDGAHLSDVGYSQFGHNMAIPLASVSKLREPGDCAGLTNTTYNDNLSAARMVWPSGARSGPTLTANNSVALSGVNYPVVLEKAVSGISFIGTQDSAAARLTAYRNGVVIGDVDNYRNVGDTSYHDYDSESHVWGRSMAGLSIFGLLFNQANLGPGLELSFAGIAIPKRQDRMVTIGAAGSANKVVIDSAGEYLNITTDLSTGKSLMLCDKSGADVFELSILSGVLTGKVYKNLSVVSSGTAGSGLPNGVYNVVINITRTGISVNLGSLGFTVATSSAMPNLKIKTPYTFGDVVEATSF